MVDDHRRPVILPPVLEQVDQRGQGRHLLLSGWRRVSLGETQSQLIARMAVRHFRVAHLFADTPPKGPVV
jgi:hypothetical protein